MRAGDDGTSIMEILIVTTIVGILIAVVVLAIRAEIGDGLGPTTPSECREAGGQAWYDRDGHYTGCSVGGRAP